MGQDRTSDVLWPRLLTKNNELSIFRSLCDGTPCSGRRFMMICLSPTDVENLAHHSCSYQRPCWMVGLDMHTSGTLGAVKR
jgi:hypothetical protein